jgi:hypothetical protein
LPSPSFAFLSLTSLCILRSLSRFYTQLSWVVLPHLGGCSITHFILGHLTLPVVLPD